MSRLINRFRRLKSRTKFCIVAIFNLTWFCIVVLILSAHDKTVPDSLIAGWFSAWVVELGLLAGIKIKSKE